MLQGDYLRLILTTLVCVILGYSILVPICQCFVTILVSYFMYKCFKKITETKVGIRGQGILITGCDTGIGHETAVLLDSLGFTVFAGCLDLGGNGATKLRSSLSTRAHLIQLDVTKEEQISKAVDYVNKNCKTSGLWAVVNNAAINRLGDVELVSMETIRSVAEVNYFGMVRITKSFLPMIKSSQGRVINITSVRGRIALPTDACYTPTKWAGEAFSDILRREMYRFGVKVIIIEPGNFGGLTGMLNKTNIALNVKSLTDSFEAASTQTRESYGRDYITTLINGLEDCGKTTHPTLLPVMKAMEHAATSTNPQCRYLIQGSNKRLDLYCVLAFLNPYLPEQLMDYILRVIDPLPPVAGGIR